MRGQTFGGNAEAGVAPRPRRTPVPVGEVGTLITTEKKVIIGFRKSVREKQKTTKWLLNNHYPPTWTRKTKNRTRRRRRRTTDCCWYRRGSCRGWCCKGCSCCHSNRHFEGGSCTNWRRNERPTRNDDVPEGWVVYSWGCDDTKPTFCLLNTQFTPDFSPRLSTYTKKRDSGQTERERKTQGELERN